MPTMTCQQCFRLYNNDEIEPSCYTGKCPIGEDLATDPVINDFVEAFVLARQIFEANQLEALFVKRLTECGLWDWPELLAQMELTYLLHRNKENERRSKHKRTSRTIGGRNRPFDN